MGKDRGNLMGNSTSSRRGRVAACREMRGERKKKEGHRRKKRGRERDSGARGGVSIKSRGFLSPQIVNMKFLWRSYRGRPTVPDVTSRTFNFRHARTPPRKREEETRRERERERLQSTGVMAIGAVRSDCQRLRRCKMHADSIFPRKERMRGNRE